MNFRSRFDRLSGTAIELDRRLLDCTARAKSLTERASAIEQAQALIQTVAQETQSNISIHIETIVQTALDFCFPGYTFRLLFEAKRGKTEARILVEDTDGMLTDPLDAMGGGVVDIVSFALRLACWSLSRSAPVMLLDEPFKNLSENLRPLAADFLRSMSGRLGIQTVMVTHDPVLIEAADRTFEICQKNGVSFVK